MTKSSTTPIVMLTLQDLRDVIREEMGSKREHVDTLTIKASQNGYWGYYFRNKRALFQKQLFE